MKKAHFIFILFFILAELVSASVFPPRPSPARWVNNLSVEMPDFLSASEVDSLENKLSLFEKQTSNQIVIVVVDDLGGLEPVDYATELGREWGVGQANRDNGIVILIKPTGGEGQRNLFIAVGYGLEGAIPDLTTKQIRENEMYPYFKTGGYYTALDKATNVLMALAKGEYNSSTYDSAKNANRSWLEKEYTIFGFTAPRIIFFIFIIFGFFILFWICFFIHEIFKRIKTARANWLQYKDKWLLYKDKPKRTVKDFFVNPYNPLHKGYSYSWLLKLVLYLLILSLFGVIVIIAVFVIAKIRKKPGSDSWRNAFSGSGLTSSSSGLSSRSSSSFISSSSSSSRSSSSFGGDSFGGGDSLANFKDKPKSTVKEFFLNPYNPIHEGRQSWQLTLVFFVLVLSMYGIIIIIAAYVIAKIRKMPGSESFFSRGGSTSSSSWSSRSSSRSSSGSSSSFGGGSFGGGGSGGNW